MPLRDAAPVGAPCWVDLYTSEPTRPLVLRQLFGWTAEDANPEFRRLLQLLEGRRSRRRLHEERRLDGRARCVGCTPRDRRCPGDRRRSSRQRRTGPRAADASRQPRHDGALADAGGAAIGAWQPANTRASASSTSRGHLTGSSSTRATTTRRWTSTEPCSVGTRASSPTSPASGTRRSAMDDAPSLASWTQRRSCPRACRRTGRCTSRRRTGCNHRKRRRARRVRGDARGRHAVRSTRTVPPTRRRHLQTPRLTRVSVLASLEPVFGVGDARTIRRWREVGQGSADERGT